MYSIELLKKKSTFNLYYRVFVSLSFDLHSSACSFLKGDLTARQLDS